MSKYNKACSEVISILAYLEEKDYAKIPENVLETIKNNADNDHEYEVDELDELDFENLEMLEETKAILFNIYRDYLCSPEQKLKIISYQSKERARDEARKQEKFSSDIFNKKEEKIVKNENIQENQMYLIKVEKENIFTRFINFFKNIFKNSKKNKA